MYHHHPPLINPFIHQNSYPTHQSTNQPTATWWYIGISLHLWQNRPLNQPTKQPTNPTNIWIALKITIKQLQLGFFNFNPPQVCCLSLSFSSLVQHRTKKKQLIFIFVSCVTSSLVLAVSFYVTSHFHFSCTNNKFNFRNCTFVSPRQQHYTFWRQKVIYY